MRCLCQTLLWGAGVEIGSLQKEACVNLFCRSTIDRGVNETSDPKVVFLGFTPSNEIVCKWESDSMRMLRLESSDNVVQAVEVAKPQVTPKRRGEGNAKSASM